MRILHVFDHSLPLQSGYVFRSLGILRAQRARGWQTVHLTSPKHTAARKALAEQVDGWTFHRTPEAGHRFPILNERAQVRATTQRLREVVDAARPDIIHAHSPVLNALPALTVGRELGIPVVYEIRAFWEDAAVDHGTTREGSLRYRATRALETWAARRVGHVFTICEGLRADLVGRGLPSDKVTVIPNAVDLKDFSAAPTRDEELARALGLEGSTVLGFVGSFYAYEGLDLLLEALVKVRTQRPDIKALLVGGGPQEEVLKAKAQSLGLEDRVVFTGRVKHDQVNRYYGLIDLLTFPRHPMRLTELVTPLKPLEAMALGRVLVASDVGGHKELIRDGATGFLFKAGSVDALAERIVEAVSNRDRWDAIRNAGRRFVETERNWDASVARYAPVYEKLALGKDVARTSRGGAVKSAAR